MHILRSSIIVLSLALISCSSNDDDVTIEDKPTYNSAIKTIIDNNCASCHMTAYNPAIDSYEALLVKIEDGSFVRAVLEQKYMPQNGSLTDAELATIQTWIDNDYRED